MFRKLKGTKPKGKAHMNVLVICIVKEALCQQHANLQDFFLTKDCQYGVYSLEPVRSFCLAYLASQGGEGLTGSIVGNTVKVSF